MSTIDQNNDIFKAKRDSGNQRISDKETLLNNELQNNEFEDIHQSNEEIAKQGYTVRNGYDPNKPNPDQEKITNDEDDLDDLDDDFHTEKDLEHDNDDDYIEEDLDDDGEDLNITNDEFDNPSDDFNETEDVLEDIDEDDDEDDDDDYKEDDVQEEDEDDDFEEEEEEQEEDYPANDPRKF